MPSLIRSREDGICENGTKSIALLVHLNQAHALIKGCGAAGRPQMRDCIPDEPYRALGIR